MAVFSRLNNKASKTRVYKADLSTYTKTNRLVDSRYPRGKDESNRPYVHICTPVHSTLGVSALNLDSSHRLACSRKFGNSKTERGYEDIS